jgi:branched-chain amino acid transport system substrate-binding protein
LATPALTSRGLANVLRTCGRDDQQAEVAAQYVLKTLKDKKIAIINDKGAYGKGLTDAFKKTLNAAGVQEVLNDAVTPGDKDFSALTTRLKSEKVEVVYFGGYHPEGGLLARQLADLGVKATIIGGDGLSNSEYWTIGTNAAAGTLFTNASDATKSPDSKAAADALAARNIPAEAFTLNAYAAVEVIKAGIEKAKSAEDAEAVAAALKNGEAIPTAIGKLTYGETGDLTSRSFELFKWQDGKIVAAE